MTEKTDLKRALDGYRARRGEVRMLELPASRFLAVDGRGDPNTAPAYREALEALYPLAYATKFASRTMLGCDYVVPPLEGLWWADDLAAFTERRDKALWRWTMMILVPDWVSDEVMAHARETARAKSARIDDVRVMTLAEGLCVQTLHVGPYDDEGPVLAELHDVYLPEHGLTFAGPHHEIYLSDVRRTDPARLRTVLRQPVRPA